MKHWTDELFIDSAEQYALDLEAGAEQARREAPLIAGILGDAGVPPGLRLLDIPCGTGRFSVELALLGYRVTGVDFSGPLVKRAREKAESSNTQHSCRFIEGDMREAGKVLGGELPFDAVLVLFTSLGYFDEDTDRIVLEQVRGATRRGGLLVIDVSSRDWMVQNFRSFGVFDRFDGVRLEQRDLNLENSRVEATFRYYKKSGDDLIHLKTVRLDHRIYSLHELRGIVGDAGWMVTGCFGGFDRRPFTRDAGRMILVAENP